jgi:hypothetical protein
VKSYVAHNERAREREKEKTQKKEKRSYTKRSRADLLLETIGVPVAWNDSPNHGQ